MQISDEPVYQPSQQEAEIALNTTEYQLTKENLLGVLAQARQLVHSAAQPTTTILLLIELAIQSARLDQEQLADFQIITEQALILKNIIQSLRGLLEQETPGFEPTKNQSP